MRLHIERASTVERCPPCSISKRRLMTLGLQADATTVPSGAVIVKLLPNMFLRVMA